MSLCLSVRPSLRMEQVGSQWTDFHETRYLSVFRNISRKFKFRQSLTRITVTLHADIQYCRVGQATDDTQYDAYALNDGHPRLQTDTQHM
jgi:hypothetical protein